MIASRSYSIMDSRALLLILMTLDIINTQYILQRWDDWTSWSKCSVTCGSGTMSRQRYGYDGYTESIKNQTRTCILTSCTTRDVNENIFYDWSPWSECSQACGVGMAMRKRECKDKTIVSYCTEDQSKSCFLQSCISPILDCSDWEEWDKCSVTCGGGMRKRSRACKSTKTRRVQEETQTDCNFQSCFQEEEAAHWSEWESWMKCSATCGSGIKMRKRNCLMYNRLKEQECKGRSREAFTCRSPVQCYKEYPVSWESWSAWSECSSTCGSGTRIRTRLCLGEKPAGGGCPGNESDIEQCFRDPCFLEIWSMWTDWNECSTTCRGGIKSRVRFCMGGVPGEGACIGNVSESVSCDLRACTAESAWSSWSPWSSCAITCGYGHSSRTRSCLKADWKQCVGKSVEYRTCADGDCIYGSVWTKWDSWGECSASCGIGWKTRTRICLNEGHLSDDCVGSNRRLLRCKGECFERYAWESWGACSASCGPGIKKRWRICRDEENCYLGKDVEGQPCNASFTCKEVYRTCGQAGDERGILDKYIRGRVVKGDDASAGAWPWQIMIVRRREDARESLDNLIGGASLINNRWALTVAHILTVHKRDLLLVLGMTTKPKAREKFSDFVRFAKIDSILKHNRSNAINYDYDIALLKFSNILSVTPNGTFVSVNLNGKITFSEHIRPVCLPCISAYADHKATFHKHGTNMRRVDRVICRKEAANLIGDGYSVVVTGFGDTRPSLFHNEEPKLPDVLQQALLKILNRKKCESGVKRINFKSRRNVAKFTNQMLCTRSMTRRKIVDACRGDSGGPLVRKVKSANGRSYWVQIGIVSWGLGCAQTTDGGYTFPGYFTNIAPISSWIIKVLNS